MYIKYGDKELTYLKRKDPKLGLLINEFGFVKRYLEKDLFESLVSSIIGQQISTVVASKIRTRLASFGNVTKELIINLDEENLRSIGLSYRKISYLKDIANHFVLNPNFEDELKQLDNNNKIEQLIKLKGVGPWTAEMLLIHYFNEPDVISFRDLAIKKSIIKLHKLDNLTKTDEIYYKNLYSPYGTIASIYLWEYSKK